ncbi:MAG: S8 family serine peptidase [Candidatus Bathyarchaeia archaeon]
MHHARLGALVLLVLLMPPLAPMPLARASELPIQARGIGSSEGPVNLLGLIEKWPARVIVEYDGESPPLPQGAKLLGNYRSLRMALLEVDPQGLERLSRGEGILGIYPDLRIQMAAEAFQVGKDYPFLGRYPILLNETVEMLGVSQLWRMGFRGENMTIAILDSGIDKTHPNFADPSTNGTKVIGEVSFAPDEEKDTKDYVGHGTFVAGIIAGTGAANASGFYGYFAEKILNATIAKGTQKGVAPMAKLYNIKVFNKLGAGQISGAVAGIDWAIEHKADVINLSLGLVPISIGDALLRAAEKAVRAGIIVVASAGNYGPSTFTITSPAISPHVIAVGACYRTGRIVYFSGRGPAPYTMVEKPDLVAPGAAVISSVPVSKFKSPYGEIWGTSASAPFVSGAAALLKQAAPNGSRRSPYAIKAALMAGAKDLGLDPSVQGAGLLNATAAYLALRDKPFLTRFATRALNSTTAPLICLYPGDFKVANLTVIAPERLVNATLEITGSVASIASFSNASRLSVHKSLKTATGEVFDPTPNYFAIGDRYRNSTSRFIANATGILSIPIQILIPEGSGPLTYRGRLRLLNGTRLIDEVEIRIDSKAAKAKILFDDVFQGRVDVQYHQIIPFDAERLWGGSLISVYANIWPLGAFDLWRIASEGGYDVDSLRQAMNSTGMGDPWGLMMSGRYDIILLFDTELHEGSASMFPKILERGTSLLILYDTDFAYQRIEDPLRPEEVERPPATGIMENFNREHPISEGVRNATFFGGIFLTVRDPAEVVATGYEYGDPAFSGVMIASYRTNSGSRLVAVGDSNAFDIGLVGDYVWLYHRIRGGREVISTDNERLALNLLRYSIPEKPRGMAYWPHPVVEAILSMALAIALGLALHYRRKARTASMKS